MCGILLHACTPDRGRPKGWSSLVEVIDERGPDVSSSHVLQCGKYELDLHASVLALRGQPDHDVTRQPILSSDGQLLLCWNGEIFDWLEDDGEEDDAGDHRDGKSGLELERGDNDALWLMARLERARRDSPGLNACDALVEVLSRIEGPYAVLLIDTRSGCVLFGRDPLGRRSLLTSQATSGDDLLICSVSGPEAEGETLVEVDARSLWFVDLTVGNGLHLQPIERLQTMWTQRLTLAELREPPQTMSDQQQDVELALLEVLSESVRKRVKLIRSPPSVSDTTARVAVLFSGGLDCSVVALLAHQHLPPEQPIDLLNVAFENPRVLSAAQQGVVGGGDVDRYAVPDRKTGLNTYQELCKVAPNRRWNFVQINVEHAAYMRQLDRITSLMSPSDSVMDLSISAALYFSARRTGVLPNGSPYTSPARVLLSGLGADELLGGYSRHRKAFQNRAEHGLVDELQMDLDRLPTRNLGRDDRILSSASVEARYPYLARPVLQFLCSLPVTSKMNLSLPEGQGDKILLRDAARRLGLVQCAGERKRAIQFGARSAKMQTGQGGIKGHERLPQHASPTA